MSDAKAIRDALGYLRGTGHYLALRRSDPAAAQAFVESCVKDQLEGLTRKLAKSEQRVRELEEERDMLASRIAAVIAAITGTQRAALEE